VAARVQWAAGALANLLADEFKSGGAIGRRRGGGYLRWGWNQFAGRNGLVLLGMGLKCRRWLGFMLSRAFARRERSWVWGCHSRDKALFLGSPVSLHLLRLTGGWSARSLQLGSPLGAERGVHRAAVKLREAEIAVEADAGQQGCTGCGIER
jgi:hypothetical protein